MGGGLSALATSQSSVTVDDLPVTDPDKCQHKFCEKWGPGHYHCADCHSTIQDQNLIASEDAIIESIVDESVAEDGVHRGVSIQFLVDFATTCNCWDMTTRDVRRRFVMPATRANRCRFVELPEMQQSPQRYVGRAGTFVSHTWGAKFGDLVAALCDGGADRSRYVWVDIFAVRQWPSRKPDLDFSAVVRQCGSFVVVCSSLPELDYAKLNEQQKRTLKFPPHVRSQIAFLRVWCLVEIHSAIKCGATIVMKGGRCSMDEHGFPLFFPDFELMSTLVLMVDIQSADATVPADKKRILNEIRASEGGVDAVNRAVRGAVTGGALSDPVVQCAACDDQRALEFILLNPTDSIVSAAGGGFVRLVKMLIDRGADKDAVEEFRGVELTPLEAAAIGGHLSCVSLLLECGFRMRDKARLLSDAAAFGHTSVVRCFLDHGCDVNSQRNGTPALFRACSEGHIECIKLLLERGADVNVVGYDGSTALGLAAGKNHAKLLQLLVDSGATRNVKSKALLSAAEAGSLVCVKILIRSGCDLDGSTAEGMTAMHLAARNGHLSCVQELLTSGWKSDENEVTPLMLAETGGHTKCIQLLKQHLKV